MFILVNNQTARNNIAAIESPYRSRQETIVFI